MLEGGLPLREWVSNYPSALNQLSEEEISSSNPVKVLGYSYDADWDSLQLKQCSLNKEAVTKGVIWRDTLKVSKNFLRFKMPVSVLWRDTKESTWIGSGYYYAQMLPSQPPLPKGFVHNFIILPSLM